MGRSAEKDRRTNGNREFTVVTKTGEIQRSRTLRFTPAGVSLFYGGPAVPREQVAEVRIRHRMPWRDALLIPPAFALAPAIILDLSNSPESAVVAMVILAPVALGVGLAPAPVVVLIEGARRLAPDKVLKVQP